MSALSAPINVGGFTGWTQSSTLTRPAALATFTGAIASNTLTVSGSVTGTALAVGQGLSGTGVPLGTFLASGSGTSWVVAQPSGAAVTVASTTISTQGALTPGTLIANSVTAGSVVVPTVSVARNNGSTGSIRRLMLWKSGLFVGVAYKVWLFSQAPVPTVGDGAAPAVAGQPPASSGSLYRLGSVTFPAFEAWTDGAVADGVPDVGGEVYFQAPSNGTSLYWLMASWGGNFVPGVPAEQFILYAGVNQDN